MDTAQHDFAKRVFGKKRYFKQINENDFHFLFDSSPLEIEKAVEVYDIESFEYFLILRFARVTERQIRSFKIRLYLYLDSPLPYKKISYTYNVPKKKMAEVLYGEGDYIPIPETYFKRYEIFIDEVEWDNGEKENVNCSTLDKKSVSAEKHVSAMDSELTHSDTAEKYPAIVMPQFSENAWICTCSQKNISKDTVCRRCSRQKSAVEKLLEKSRSGEFSKNQYSSYQRSRKAEHITARTTEKTSEEMEKKIEAEIEKVEKREKYKDKMKIQVLPRIVLYFVAGYLIYLFLRWVESL